MLSFLILFYAMLEVRCRTHTGAVIIEFVGVPAQQQRLEILGGSQGILVVLRWCYGVVVVL
jgi:hypothetical protein